jgi:hypothetical protein
VWNRFACCALLFAACTSNEVDSWDGRYGIELQNRDNGCELMWPTGSVFAGLIVAETGDDEALGIFPADIVIPLGTDLLHSNESLFGLIANDELALYGQARFYMNGACAYRYYPVLRATRAGNVMTGEIHYTLVTEQAGCNPTSCTNTQALSGERPDD